MQTFAEGSAIDSLFSSLSAGVVEAVNSAVTALGGVMPAIITVLGVTLGVGIIMKFVRRNAKG